MASLQENKGLIRTGAGIAGLAIVAFLVWLFLPTDVRVEAPDEVAEQTGERRVKRKVAQLAAVADDEPLPLEEDPDIPVVTPHCKLLVEYERRKVPQYTLLDTLRDQSMRFTEDDLGCLTAAGASPAILDLAEQRMDYNALRGIKGTPGKNLTAEHRTAREHPTNRDK